MEYTYHDLKSKNLTELKKIASKIKDDAVKGYSQLNKEHLLHALCKVLKIEEHDLHEVVGVNKIALKSSIKKLKAIRDQALNNKETDKYKKSKLAIRRIKRKLRKSTQ